MKSLTSSPIILIAALLPIISCDKDDNEDEVVEVVGCKNPYATNYNPNATTDCDCCEFTQGEIVLWADSTSVISGCGSDLTIKLTDTQNVANLVKYKGYLLGNLGEFTKAKREIGYAVFLYRLTKKDYGVAVSKSNERSSHSNEVIHCFA